MGNNWLGRLLLKVNQALIHVSKGLFGYQIFLRASAKPTVEHLLAETIDVSTRAREDFRAECQMATA